MHKGTIACLVFSFLAACGGIPSERFHVRAVDVENRPLTCLVVVGDDWEGAARAERYTQREGTVPVDVVFNEMEKKVRVKAAILGEDGKPKQTVSPTSQTKHTEEVVRVRADDPRKLVFILLER